MAVMLTSMTAKVEVESTASALLTKELAKYVIHIHMWSSSTALLILLYAFFS
jgi:hypothetical protein